MNAVFTKFSLILVATTLLLGCSTTGDPSKGGLFGWSEKKAQKRQDDLNHQAEIALNRANETRRRQDELKSNERELDESVRRLEASIVKLMAENDELRNTFTGLMAEQASADAKLIGLQNDLDQTHNLIFQPPPISFSDQHADRIRLQNKRLNSAILLLLRQR